MPTHLRLLPLASVFAIAACGAVEQTDEATGDTGTSTEALGYAIVDTAQTSCYGVTVGASCPAAGAGNFGQDAQYQGNAPSYVASADGLTVYDRVTRLTWQKSPDVNGDGKLGKADKLTATAAVERCASLAASKHAGFDDWRLPSIKELYSLIDFRGGDPSGYSGSDTSSLKPYLDTAYFSFDYGHTDEGERVIDSQYASSTRYVSKAGAEELLFGVNFADGRIKGYGLKMPGGGDKTFFVQCVRGNPDYGKNQLVDGGDQTVADKATGLTWSKADSGEPLDYEHALAWVASKNASGFLGHDDWRLPNAKELQSILDYSRSPDGTGGPAIDPIFSITKVTNEAGVADWPWFWASTTHASSDGHGEGVYFAFGRATGWMKVGSASCYSLVDVHGAGAQRSDPKVATGLNELGKACDGSAAYGFGPQGDVLRGRNFVRLVRGGATLVSTSGTGGGDADTTDAPPPGETGAGPTSCSAQSDCERAGACPSSSGCACSDTPTGKACVPKCKVDSDCPKPPDTTLTCGAGGLCVPAR